LAAIIKTDLQKRVVTQSKRRKMANLFAQLNSDFSHADVVFTTPPPSGSSLAATVAVEKSEFCFIAESFDFNANRPTTEQDLSTFQAYSQKVMPIMWRVNLHITAGLLSEYKNPRNSAEEKEEWKQRLWISLWNLNQKAHGISELLSLDPQALMVVSPVPNVSGANWYSQLTKELTQLFIPAYHAATSRTETAVQIL
jgi:hypothetical protein